MTTPRATTLLTGATGLVGSEWLKRLLAGRTGRRVVALSRSPLRVAVHPRVTAFEAELSTPGLGLSGNIRADLERSVVEIVHCAADIRFGLPLGEARLANVEATRNVLEFAKRCRRLAKLAHVSTVYAAGKQAGDLFERPFQVTEGFLNSYQQSKHEAESLALDAMRDLPAAIFRLSSIVGDSNGRVRQFNYFHQLVKMLPRSDIVRRIPGHPAAPIDLICGDWAARALDFLFERRFQPGRIYHVCAGPAASLTVRQLVDRTFQVFERHPLAQKLRPFAPPELVPLAEYERYRAELGKGREGVIGAMLRALDQFLPHLAIYQAFHNPETAADLRAGGIEAPPIASYYDRVVEYCLETDWGRGRAPQ